MRDFRNKVAAITGAGSGMGRALALELARATAPWRSPTSASPR
jgi:NAD(P)-dependent dehydrogenase (short-subunit alcohol dehydrogenase family)